MSNFRLDCFRTLEKEIGELDAICEIIEISLRHFNSISGYNSYEDKIRNISNQVGIKVDAGHAETVTAHASLMYIVSIYGCLDKFFSEFIDQVKRYKISNWLGKNKDESKLDNILRNLGLSSYKNSCVYKGYEFYRQKRNRLAHSLNYKNLNFDESLRKEIFALISKKQIHYNAFNDPETTFDDFIVFSNVAQLIAWELCNKVEPSNLEEWKRYLDFEVQKKRNGKRFDNYLKFELSKTGVKNIDKILLDLKT